jgi:hypothetical protein
MRGVVIGAINDYFGDYLASSPQVAGMLADLIIARLLAEGYIE